MPQHWSLITFVIVETHRLAVIAMEPKYAGCTVEDLFQGRK